ncbi:MAG: helix-turn-helix transcriptional regulator [Lachnospiraceae bacterium]|nr:helix-turn-helix transcriptional regulator [Lachnospiraceae bacterium]
MGRTDPMDKKVQYSKKLSEELDELCIRQSELGRGVGRSQKTISRYVLGETLPDEETQKAISEFIGERSVYENFHHIPSGEFARLLQFLLDEFKGEITQKQLAKKIGKYQKDISFYISNTIKADTRTQRDIIKVFYDLCKIGCDMSATHFGTAVNLRYLLYGEEEDTAYLLDTLGVQFGEQAVCSQFVQYYLTLPGTLQRFILEHFDAFYDQNLESILETDFQYLSYGIELFRQLSEKKKKIIVDELERDAFMGFPASPRERWFYKLLTSYRNVIAFDLSEWMQERCYPIMDIKERQNVIRRIESRIGMGVTEDRDIIREVKFKLRMTQYEWYLWSLFLIYQFQGKDLFLLCNRMIEIIHDAPPTID